MPPEPLFGGLLGAGVSQLPSLELFECRLFVLDMELAPGGVDVRLCRELGGGVTCPLDLLRGDDGAVGVGLLHEDDVWYGSWLRKGSSGPLSSSRLRSRRLRGH